MSGRFLCEIDCDYMFCVDKAALTSTTRRCDRRTMIRFQAAVLCCLCTILVAADSSESPTSSSADTFTARLVQIFHNIQDEDCRRHTLQILQGVENFEPWALQMVDASSKLQSGLLEGNIKNLGHYDECVEARAPAFAGQYCLGNVQLAPLPGASHHAARLLDTITLGRMDREITYNRTNLPVPDLLPSLSLIQVGVCVPSSCTTRDVELTLSAAMQWLARPAGLQASAQLFPGSCSVLRAQPWSTADLAVIFLVTLLVTLVVAGSVVTLLGLDTKTEGWRRLLVSFSLVDNWGRLVATGPPVPGTFSCLDGIRVVSTLWVILGHKITFYLKESWINKVIIVESATSLAKMPITNNMLSVDTFLLISGMLKAYNFLREVQHKKFDFFSCYSRRYLRLTPAYAMMIVFYATLLPRISTGPMWHSNVELPSAACTSNWFLNLLYLNNYVKTDNLCMVQSWYLATDMQLHLLAPLLLYPVWRLSQHAVSLLAVAVAVAIVVPFVYIFATEALPIYMLNAPDSKLLHYVTSVHFATHTRAAPFVVGLALGYLFFKIGSTKIKMTKTAVAAGWVLSAVLHYLSLYGAYDITQYDHNYSRLEAALYGALHRPAWAVSIAWLVFACHAGYGGWINQLLSARIFQPLSRLSYCVFLSHYVLLMTATGRMRTAAHVTEYDLLHSLTGDFMLSLVTAACLHLLVEAPAGELTKMLYRKKQPATKAVKPLPREASETLPAADAELLKEVNLLPFVPDVNDVTLEAKQR